MNKSEIKPSIAVFHINERFFGILTGRSETIQEEPIYEVIQTSGSTYWALARLLVTYKRRDWP